MCDWWTHRSSTWSCCRSQKLISLDCLRKHCSSVCQPAERSLTAQTIAINHRCVYWIRCWSTTAQIHSVLGFLVKACQSWISQALAVLVLFRKKYSSCNFSPCLGPLGRGSFISQRGGLSRKMDSMSQRKAGVHLQNRFHFAPITFNNPNQPLVTPSHRWW